MDCRSCGKTSHRIKTVYTSEGPIDKCTYCGLLSNSGAILPDVWYGYGSGEHTEENICYPKGHEKEGQCIPFSSKQGKAEAMKIARVREGGDSHHGARTDYTKRKIYG